MRSDAAVSRGFPWGTSVTTRGEAVNVSYHDRQWMDQRSA